MEDKVSKLSTEVSQLKDRISKLESLISNIERKIDEIHRETGAREGRELYRQIEELERKSVENQKLTYDLVRDSTAIRKAVEFNDNYMKEIRQALALIYRNTDELENHLMGEDRETKN